MLACGSTPELPQKLTYSKSLGGYMPQLRLMRLSSHTRLGHDPPPPPRPCSDCDSCCRGGAVMDDKTLADKAAKLAGFVPDTWAGVTTYRVGLQDTVAERFVRDPRVAMALMERCRGAVITIDLENTDEYITMEFLDRDHFVVAVNGDLPRAIIEACVTALEAK